MNKSNNDIDNIVDIEKNSDGKLTVSTTAVQKLIHNLLVAEHYQVNLNGITIINDNDSDNTNLEARIQLLVDKNANLINLKQKIIKLVLNRIASILNINFININLIFNAVK